MTTYRSAVVHTTILAPPDTVAAFLGDLHNWTAWAPWVQSVTRSSPRDWTLETESGALKFRFGESNAFGILDHDVALPSGETVTNSMRVVPNGAGSELVMLLLQWPHLTSQEFDRDVEAVTSDLARIKQVLERQTSNDAVAGRDA